MFTLTTAMAVLEQLKQKIRECRECRGTGTIDEYEYDAASGEMELARFTRCRRCREAREILERAERELKSGAGD